MSVVPNMTDDERTEKLAEAAKSFLTLIGEDPTRDGLLKTPHRFAKAWEFLTSGYTADIEKIINGAHFTSKAKDMVVVRGIPLFSLCEHHLLPWFGVAHVGYIPDQKVVGLSKIPRIVDVFARRLQIQEQLTCQIAETLQKHLSPKGVAVVVEARHTCVEMRGVQKIGSVTTTSEMIGAFRDDQKTRAEFLSHLGRSSEVF